MIYCADVLGPVLRCGQPVQEAAHLHGEGDRLVQGQETPRGAAPCLRHHRLGLPEHAPRYVVFVLIRQRRSCFSLFFTSSAVSARTVAHRRFYGVVPYRFGRLI